MALIIIIKEIDIKCSFTIIKHIIIYLPTVAPIFGIYIYIYIYIYRFSTQNFLPWWEDNNNIVKYIHINNTLFQFSSIISYYWGNGEC